MAKTFSPRTTGSPAYKSGEKREGFSRSHGHEVVVRTSSDDQIAVLGSNGYPLQSSTVYGPIRSRRLGWSLGINLLPASYKFCNFDCVYCQYGWTPRHGHQEVGANGKLKSAAQLLAEAKTTFRELVEQKTKVDVITIAGNGEPTLHPEFPEMVRGLLQLRTKFFPGVPVGVLSNSSQCHRPRIREALELLDQRFMKLDAGDPKTMAAINRVRTQVDFDRMIDGLKKLNDITIQSLFVQGTYNNTKPQQVEEWVAAIGTVAPKTVQVYTIDRPPAEPGVEAVSKERLREIAELCSRRTKIPAEVFD